MTQPTMACRLLYRYHVPVLVAAFVATIIGVHFARQLPLQSDIADLLPESFESVKALDRVSQEVGGTEQLRVVLESEDFASLEAFAHALAPRLLASRFVNYVDYENDVAFYKTNALLFLDTLELDSLHEAIQNTIDTEKRKLNPLFVDDLFGASETDDGPSELEEWEAKYSDDQPKRFYMNEDSTVLVMKVFPSQSGADLASVRAMVAEVRQIADSVRQTEGHAEVAIYYGGGLQNRIDEFETVKKDLLGTAFYGVGGVFLLILIYFRRFVGVVLISISLLCSLAWTFGLAYVVIGHLNTITGFLFVILFGLGIDYGIHVFARYVEGRKEGLNPEAALDKAVCQTGKALATTAVTTAGAFFALVPMDFKGFSDLGFISGTGILFSLVAMVLILPALLLVVERIGLLTISPAPAGASTRSPQQFTPAKTIVALGALLTLLAAFLFTRVPFEYDFTNLRVISPGRQLVSDKTSGIFTLSESPAVVLADSKEQMEEIVAAVEQKITEDTLSPTVETVRSVFSLVPEDQTQRLTKIREMRRLVDEEAEGVVTGEDEERLDELQGYLQVDRPFTWADFPKNQKRQFVNKNGQIGHFVFVYPSVALRDGRNAIAFRNDIGQITTASGDVVYAASPNIISAEMFMIMIREGRVAVTVTFIVVLVIVLADFRSVKAALLVGSPLAIGVLWMGGLMYVLGLRLNFFNVVVFPSIIGIGIDNGVHIYHRYKEEGPGSLVFVLKKTGRVIAMTTLTTIVGYSGLILASHPGLNSIGNLAVIGLSTTLVAALFLLPAVLQLLEKTEARA